MSVKVLMPRSVLIRHFFDQELLFAGSEAQAVWVFHLAEDENRHHLLTGMRNWIWFYAVLPTQAGLLLLKFTRFTTPKALANAGFELLISLLLAELFFLNFRKAPFSSLERRTLLS